MSRAKLFILTFMFGTLLLASAQTPEAKTEPIPTVSQHPAVILYDGRLPDAYTKNVENLEAIRPFFGHVEDFLCKIEGLKNVRLIINIANKLTPSIIFDNSTIAETGLATISINHGLFTNFTVRQLEVALALIIATYSPIKKGPSGIDTSPIALARSMPTNIIGELILAIGALGFGAASIIVPSIYGFRKRSFFPLVGISIACASAIYFADQVRRNTIVHVPQIIFKEARAMLSEKTREDLAKNPEHYLQTLAILAQVVSYSVHQNFFIEDIFNRAFYKFSLLAQEEQSGDNGKENSPQKNVNS